MYKIINFILILFFIFFSTNLKAQNKVTFINLEYVLNNTLSGKIIVDEIENLKKKNELKFSTIENEIKSKEQSLINKKNIISEIELEKNYLALKKEVDQFNLNRKNSIINYENLKKKKLDNYFEKISPIIEAYIIENSISVVLNQKDVFIGNKKSDITTDIINLIDNKIKWYH